MDTCLIGKCDKKKEKRGMCGMHYRRYQRYGDPLFVSPDWRSGRKNPNCVHKDVDDRLFSEVDSCDKAYLLGWIASDGNVRKSGFSISIHEKDRHILPALQEITSGGKITRHKTRSVVSFVVNSQEMARDVAALLGIPATFGKKSSIVKFPEIQNLLARWAFIRGFFDGDGHIRTPSNKGSPECGISSNSQHLLASIQDMAGGKLYVSPAGEGKLSWSGAAALDFLGKLYADTSYPRLSRKHDLYVDSCLWSPTLSCNNKLGNEIRYSKNTPDVPPLLKHHVSDSGYDIAVISKIKQLGDVTLYGTGIKISPPFGYYFDLVPRSSISKTGYTLANSVGIIDRSYVGEIMVPLRKSDPAAPELPLPSRVVQLIPRQIVHFDTIEVEELPSSERGSGGFGSTGK